MNVSKITAIVVAIWWVVVLEMGGVRADELDDQKKALDILSEFADKICGDISPHGKSNKIELSGKAKAELPSIIKKLADLGFEGAAKYQNSEYEGVLQSDLATVLKDSRNCRREIVKELQDKLIPTRKPTEVSPPSKGDVPSKRGAKDRPKLPPTTAELEQHLREQVRFLCMSSGYFDRGMESEGKRIASSLHILFVDTEDSPSLLEQMRIRDEIQLPNTAYSDRKGNQAPYMGLVAMSLGDGRKTPYIANRLAFPDSPSPKTLPFERWWRMIILDNHAGLVFTRASLVIAVAQQDGGIRVASGLDPSYVELARKHGIGWRTEDTGEDKPLLGVELHSIRAIAWEVIEAISKQYPKYLPK